MVTCMWCSERFRASDHVVCPYCYEGHCIGCGIAPEDGYTEGCEECSEARAELYALTGDNRYKAS